jgi:FkbM family methyltransferase
MSRWLLDASTRLGRSVGDIVLGPLDKAGVDLLVVDAGARNGMYLLPASYTRRATLVGFEPNPVEYRKLVENNTDSEKYFARQGVVAPRFKSNRFHDCALWDSDGEQTLYLTRGAGACTLMGPTKPLMTDTYYLYREGHPGRNKSFYDLHAEVLSTEPIACRALDNLIPDDETVDFLKIDVEGAELRCLRGAERLLSSGRVLFIQSEFQLMPYYNEHPLLGDQQRYLADRGYRLIDLVLDHPRYRRGEVDVPNGSDRGMLMAGDAIFVRDPDAVKMTSLELHRLAALALVFRFSALGLSLLRDAKLLSSEEMDAVVQTIRTTPIKGWKGRLLDRWAQLPVDAYSALQKMKATLRSGAAR